MSNTLNTQVGDIALVETFVKGGSEPTIGQTYYIDFTRIRSLFNTRTFTSLADVVATYGDLLAQRTLSLGAYLAFANGASAIACKQIPLAEGQSVVTEDQVTSAISDIEGEIVPGLSPSVIVPSTLRPQRSSQRSLTTATFSLRFVTVQSVVLLLV